MSRHVRNWVLVGITLGSAWIWSTGAAAQQEGENPFFDEDVNAIGPPANPQGDPGAPEGGQCNFVDFEDVDHVQPVGTVAGTPTVTFAVEWVGCVDDDGAGCNIANEPSPDTITTAIGLFTPINFDSPVGSVDFYYSAWLAALPAEVELWDGPDGTGSVVGSVTLNTNGYGPDGANCAGDPEGDFCLWVPDTVIAPQGNALSMTVSTVDVSSGIGFDDMLFCVGAPVPTFPNPAWMVLWTVVMLAGTGFYLRRVLQT